MPVRPRHTAKHRQNGVAVSKPLKRRKKGSTPPLRHRNTHIKMMLGKNGNPIKIANLPSPSFPAPPYLDHTQYETILLKHESKEQTFEYAGTNGFTAKINANSKE